MSTETPAGEYLMSLEESLQALAATEKVFKAKIVLDTELRKLNFQNAVDSLGYALKNREQWAVERVAALKQALDEYVTAKGEPRMDAFADLVRAVDAAVFAFKQRGKKAA